ncbi:DUF1573 domain-containing protein [bacterium]|nr:DUF1573 domain-containing protein [bacterium]
MKIKSFLLIIFLLFLISFSFLSAQAEVKSDLLCGPNSLLVVCQKLGVETNLDELKKLSDYDDKKGTTMAGLAKAAEAKGLYAVGMKLSLDDIAKLKIPIIAYLRNNHCLVIDGFEGGNLRIIDPPKEPRLVSKKDFTDTYSGFSLLISKGKIPLPKIETKKPDIRFDVYIYNFDVIEQSKNNTLNYIFKFKNAGKEDLIISKVKACCGANATLLSEKNIPPQGEGEIKATVNIRGRTGEQNYGIHVYCNDPVTPVVILQVKGTIKRELHVSRKNIDFGYVKKEAVAIRKFYIIGPEDRELKIIKIESSSDYLYTNFYKSTNENYEGWEVKVNISPDIPIGEFKGKLIIYTDDKKHPKIEISVTGNIKGDIELRPDMFFFGFVKREETSSCKVTIFTTSKEPLKIEKIESSLQFVSVAINPKVEGKEYEITATLKDNAPVGSIKGNITIYTNNLTQPKIEIPVYGLVKPR